MLRLPFIGQAFLVGRDGRLWMPARQGRVGRAPGGRRYPGLVGARPREQRCASRRRPRHLWLHRDVRRSRLGVRRHDAHGRARQRHHGRRPGGRSRSCSSCLGPSGEGRPTQRARHSRRARERQFDPGLRLRRGVRDRRAARELAAAAEVRGALQGRSPRRGRRLPGRRIGAAARRVAAPLGDRDGAGRLGELRGETFVPHRVRVSSAIPTSGGSTTGRAGSSRAATPWTTAPGCWAGRAATSGAPSTPPARSRSPNRAGTAGSPTGSTCPVPTASCWPRFATSRPTGAPASQACW